MNRIPVILTALVAGLTACDMDRADEDVPQTGEGALEGAVIEEPVEQFEEAADLVNAAIGTLQEMQEDPELWTLAQAARGVFVVPQFGRAAAGVGVRGGEGVLLTQTNQAWSDPAFYDLGGVSVGAQLGASGGEIALILLTPEALESFEQPSSFSINADAGLVILDYSALAQASADRGDVIVWSDTEGAFAGVALSVSGITFDEEENVAYYQQPVTPTEIMEGSVTGPQTDELQSQLSR